MRYSKVFIDAIGYEIAPVVVSSRELEEKLSDVYRALHIAPGQLESLTGISERRWWKPGHRLSDGAFAAARRALESARLTAPQIEVLIYAGVCREHFEPATACRVGALLGVGPETVIHDVSNACLGVLTGMIDVANRIELGQIKAGMVVACESAREINEIMIGQMRDNPSMSFFKHSLATLTGGSGAVAVILSDGSLSAQRRRRLLGGTIRSAPAHHELCRWGIETHEPGEPGRFRQFTSTDAASVLTHGVELGQQTWRDFSHGLGWREGKVDKVICHQVGRSHKSTILASLGIPEAKDFSTFEYLGNMGTVALPLTAGLAEDRAFLAPGDNVAFVGIGSGLNCMMLGIEW
jgi:3-oxoacyl-[acyl-carrier-protein] synthase-3